MIRTWRLKIENYLLRKIGKPYHGKYLKIRLKGGLCNKLYCLFSACDIAFKRQAYIIEPYFGWHKKILFSDIFDINLFNSLMSQYNNGEQLIYPKDMVVKNKNRNKIIKNYVDLWEYSVKDWTKEQETGRIESNSTKLLVLNALKLRKEYEHIVNEHVPQEPFTAIQIRTESDWQKYSKYKVVDEGETLLIDLENLLNMLASFNTDKHVFFTSGENHEEIYTAFIKRGYNTSYFYNPDFEYEINAAINFEICSKANAFIGLSRSTYSNLITLKRAVISNNDNSYIYNYKNKIYRRVDKGGRFN